MCGIFGIIANKETQLKKEFFTKSINYLANASMSRGKDSSGLCLFNQSTNEVEVYKGPIPINRLMQNKDVIEAINNNFKHANKSFYGFGHARLVTNGTQLKSINNQPVIKDETIGIHNGIIVNVDDLWSEISSIKREYEIDTEVLLALINDNLKKTNSIKNAISIAINKIYGTVASALLLTKYNKFVLATNNGSLYTIQKEGEIIIFASEKYILQKLAKKMSLQRVIGKYKIKQVMPMTGLVCDIGKLTISNFDLSDSFIEEKTKPIPDHPGINIYKINPNEEQTSVVMDLNYIHLHPEAEKLKKLLIYPINEIKSLKRCTKCILPQTFPFLYFDSKGVCNYCNNYVINNKNKSINDLLQLVEPYRKSNGSQEVLLPYSGGRDSTYTLHIVKNELGLNPVTFTYDWGMVTDLARRNIARACGELGIENIIVAADMHWKRNNIRKNILAWLKNPELGMIPLFMAGDKYFFYYARKIKKQLDIDLEIWGINNLENTDFKVGFSGIKPEFNKKRIYSISVINQLKLFGFVGKNIIKSPRYLNQSVLDSIGSIASRYFTSKKDYFHLFDYLDWDEDVINSTIEQTYSWEKAVDTDSTWRIGDGTASFYNYIYTLVSGFCENDTFRSNQIREGLITRERALSLIYRENIPRYNSLKWYLDIIGLDYKNTIDKINTIPNLKSKLNF
jgi:glutamine---fructose-6-phosphate transaminase (isomerizing)